MESLQKSFAELRHRLKAGRGSALTGDDPVWYLVFPPDRMLAVKRQMKQWKSLLKLDGWTTEVFSMADAVREILQGNDLRAIWLESEAENPHDFAGINATLTDALTAAEALLARLRDRLENLAGREATLLMVTDLEALHPYLRVGTLEQRLQGKFTVPTVFLYPGLRSGKTSLRFLGIYPEDGNYRSIHIGG